MNSNSNSKPIVHPNPCNNPVIDSVVSNAIWQLSCKGILVEKSDIPGLYWVQGRELTINQLVDYAMKQDK